MPETLSTRAVRQYLADLARAGVTHVPRPVLEEVAAAPVSEPKPDIVPARTPEPPRPPVPAAAATAVVPTPTPARKEPREVAAEPTAASGSRSDRLCALAESVAACTRCTELAGTRTQTVFGVGDPHARILFLGEAPGADEDRQGEPFVGKAGKLLDRIITACKLRREDVYICNVLKCRPPGNRNPSPEEADNCREHLDAQIATVDPEYIVCWGSVAAQNLLDTKSPVGRLRGRFHEYGRAKVLCTYHPSYLLRNPPAKKDVWEDMQFLFRDMGVDLKEQ